MAIIPLDEVETLAYDKLRAAGCNEENARATARWIYYAERDGSSSHGLFRLPGYIASIRSKKINPLAQPDIVEATSSVIRVNANDGMAPLANERGIEALIPAAQRQGIAILVVNNSYHFSALWIEAEMIAKNNLVAMTFTAHTPMVAPYGGKTPVFSTNPMAFAWPRGDEEPMVFDQASAAMARGDIQLAALNGEKLPDGVGVDADGNPTNDPKKVLEGAQLPFGGYKGSNIALMIELLVGPMINDHTSIEAGKHNVDDGGPARGGQIIVAIDPEITSGSAQWQDQASALFEAVLSQPGAILPGDRRRDRRKSVYEYGVIVSEEVLHDINKL